MNLLEFIKLGQYTYKLGFPLLQDTEYDELVRKYQNENPDKELNLHWEEISDLEGIELLKKYGAFEDYTKIINLVGEMKFDKNLYLELKETEQDIIDRYYEFKQIGNKSMPIVTEMEELKKVVEHISSEEVLLSLKLDGWNITIYIEDGEIAYAHTRGRQAEAQDVTSIIKHALKKRNLNLEGITKGYVVGELILRDKYLEPLRMKYRKRFRTTRNSVSSFINNTVIAEDLDKVDFVAFNCDFENIEFEKQSDVLEHLSEVGFEIPNYIITKGDFDGVFMAYVVFSDKINTLPPSDGVVIQPNGISQKEDLNQLSIFPDSYEVGLYAIKMLNWGTQILKTIITGIDITRNTKNIKPSLIVEPVRTREGRTINNVPVDHIGRLVDENLYIGKEISINVVSEKDIRLAYDRNKAEARIK